MFTQLSKENLKYKLPEFKLGKCWIAGGAIRDSIINTPHSDIDIFGPSKEALDEFIKDNLSSATNIHDIDMMKSFILNGNKIQVIYRFYPTLEDCLDSFDYTICQFGFNGENIVCNPESLIHLYEKRLVVNKLNKEFVVDSLRRMQKYIKKGYTICNGGLKSIVTTIRDAEPKVIEDSFTYYPGGGLRINRFD